MEITSVWFYLFVGISLLIYWRLPQKYQWKLLLADSILFYCFSAHPATILYLAVSIVSVHCAVSYFKNADAEVLTENTIGGGRRKVLILTLLVNIGLLAVLKYTNLAVHTWNIIFGSRGVVLGEVHWLAPLAISFYTLQLVSYLLDCYWGIAEPVGSIEKLALYASYFPQMVSGPISRRSQIGDQLFEQHSFDYDRVVHGLKRIAWGLLKKKAVSDRVAVVVSALWTDPELYRGFYVWIAAMGFVIQLYTDFSGCMDIILGVSECFGIYLPENFRAPLLSKTIQEFWQRWHITLGRWLRDYIMNPVQKSDAMIKLGNWCRKKFGKKKGRRIPVYLSMLVLWLCMGLWHGDSWKYILGEGLWFWLVIVAGQMMGKTFARWKQKLHIKERFLWQAFQIVRTFLIVTVGNLFFYADSFRDALHRIILGMRVTFDFATFKSFAHLCASADLGGKTGFLVAVFSFLLVAVVDVCIYQERNGLFQFFERHKVIRWMGYYMLVTLLVLSLDIGTQEFLYAQF